MSLFLSFFLTYCYNVTLLPPCTWVSANDLPCSLGLYSHCSLCLGAFIWTCARLLSSQLKYHFLRNAFVPVWDCPISDYPPWQSSFSKNYFCLLPILSFNIRRDFFGLSFFSLTYTKDGEQCLKNGHWINTYQTDTLLYSLTMYLWKKPCWKVVKWINELLVKWFGSKR